MNLKYAETTLKGWIAPASDSEETKIQNTINMIRNAIDSSDELKDLTIEIFIQGSYANNTNVRTNSDIDVCVMLTSTFFTEYPEGKCNSDYGFIKGSITYQEYQRRVKKAIISKFGNNSVTLGNKSIKIKSNSYHVNADVVVAFLLKDFRTINSFDPRYYVEGIRFLSSEGDEVTNYPKEHINNGKRKNTQTNHRYKYLTRIFKRIRNAMVEEQLINGDIISSFLVECLVWNVPNSIIENYTWTETVKESIRYLYNAIENQEHLEWGEVSERLYLFRGRKWTENDAQSFLLKMWNFLGYDE